MMAVMTSIERESVELELLRAEISILESQKQIESVKERLSRYGYTDDRKWCQLIAKIHDSLMLNGESLNFVIKAWNEGETE